MKVIYLNAELDSTKEFELFKITDKGFKVSIEYKKDSWLNGSFDNNIQVFEYCSEIHNLFSNDFNEKSIAFESEIRADGFVRQQKYIECVTIELQ
jgi:hypothetical protein